LEITYIANCGFLLKSGNKKILVDALFGDFESDWCVTPPGKIIEKMETSTEPFDQIDVILISHAHVDHFNKEIVLKHLVSNEAGILICPEQVRMELENDKRYEKISARVKEVTPEKNMSCQSLEIKGMKIKVWGLIHSAYYIRNEETKQIYNKHEKVQNLGFTIEIDDQKVFHGGDWEYDSRGENRNPLDQEQFFITFLGIGAYMRLFGPNNRKTVHFKKPENVILMHMPPHMDQLTEEYKKSTLETTIFSTSMETKVF